jgi:RNA polymerase sigma factor (sigma-70 family)
MKKPFEAIVAGHGTTVLRVCRAVLGPGPDSEDAWQETFLAALGAYPQLPADANVEAWLVTIAHRKAIDAVRAAARRALPSDDLPDAVSPLGIPEDLRFPRDREPDLWAALASLPEKQRLAVAYHHVAGLPYREVAGILGGTPEAARRAAADGIKRLRDTVPRPSPSATPASPVPEIPTRANPREEVLR